MNCTPTLRGVDDNLYGADYAERKMTGFLGKLFAPLANLISGVLEQFHSLGAPWWLSIVLLTILVRVFLFPLTVRQVKNMRAMQELKPEMDEIRAKYKNNRQKQQEKLMELYKERRVNPMAGFIPILIQLPIFITMYRVVRYHEENFESFTRGGLLWFSDLTQSDPYFILPILSATILIGAMEISSKKADPNQKRMMRIFPLVFTVFIARFPSGLLVYWVTSNTVTLVQNYLIYHRPGKARVNTGGQNTHEQPVASPSKEDAGVMDNNRQRNRKTKRTDRNRKKRKKKRR